MRGRIARSGQAGFTYLEVLIGILVLAIVAGAMVQGFAASSAQVARSKGDTVASDLAQSALEQSRQVAYDDLGTVGGNPDGTLPASVTRTVGGTDYVIQTTVAYVDDRAQGRPQTFVNYKKVTIRVTPQVTGAEPVVATTLAAPPNYGAVDGKATAVITVVDALTLQPVSGVSVRIDGSTSPQRNDSTDANGQVVFGGLLPSATGASDPKHWYYATVNQAGFVTDPTSVPTRQTLTASQTWNATIKVFRPATIRVNLRDKDTGSPVTEFSTVTVTPPSPGVAQSFTTTAGDLDVTQLGGNVIAPTASNYTVSATADCYQPASVSSPVPVGYPANTIQLFTLNMQRTNGGTLDVTVKNNNTNARIPGATVSVTGGQDNVNVTRTADANGQAHFCLSPSGGTRYAITVTAPGFGAGTVQAHVLPNQNTPVTLGLVPAGTTGSARVSTGMVGVIVRVQAMTGTYDGVKLTGLPGYADFTSLAPGSYMAYRVTGFVNGDFTWSTGVPFSVSAGTLTAVGV